MNLTQQRVIRVVAAAAIVIGGYSHYHLYKYEGYQHTPVGGMFLLDFISSLVIGALLLVGPRRIVAFLGLGISFLTLLGFVLSRGPGVPTLSGTTFKETGLSPQTVHLLGVEIALLVVIVESVAIVLTSTLLLAHGAETAPVAAGRAPAA
jgi:hypothetical protein